MTPSNTPKQMKIQRTVFDLSLFDDVKLTKEVPEPAKPETLEAALAAVGNDQVKLLSIIHAGLISHEREQAAEDITGFKVVSEDGTEETSYTGKFADEETGKKINGAVLGLAKALGFEKSLPKEKKAALKEQAIAFIRTNPAILASIQGVPATPETPALSV